MTIVTAAGTAKPEEHESVSADSALKELANEAFIPLLRTKS
jgi:hypothetical protein